MKTQRAGGECGDACMGDQRTVVVTGYGNWARTSPNPASLTLRALASQAWGDCRLVPIEVPVKTGGLLALVEDAILTYRPAVWLGLGVAPGAAAIRVEAVGINCRDFDVPDNDDVKLDGVPVVDGGADAHFSTLPVGDIVDAMRDAEIPASRSYSAGTHLCNQMLYTSLHLAKRHGLGTLCGFMHVPYTPELASKLAEAEGLQPSMAVSVMTAAARITVERSLVRLENDTAAGRGMPPRGAGRGDDNNVVSVAGG